MTRGLFSNLTTDHMKKDEKGDQMKFRLLAVL